MKKRVFIRVIEVPMITYGEPKDSDYSKVMDHLEALAGYYYDWLFSQGLKLKYDISYDKCGSFGTSDPLLCLCSYHLTLEGFRK